MTLLRSVGASLQLLSSREKVVFWLLTGSRIVSQTLDLIALAGVGLIGSIATGGLGTGAALSFFSIQLDLKTVDSFVLIVSSVAGLFILKSLLGSALLRVTTRFLAGVEARASRDIAAYLFSGSLTRLKSQPKGKQQWLLTESTHVAFSTMLFAGASASSEASLLVLVFAFFFWVDASSALALMAYFVVVLGVFQFLVNGRLLRLGERLGNSLVGVNETLLILNKVYREASVLGVRGYFLKRFDHHRTIYARDLMLHRFVMGLPRFFIETALMGGLLLWIIWQSSRGDLSESLVTTGVFLAGGLRMMAAMLPLQNAINELRTFAPQASAAQDMLAQVRTSRDNSLSPSPEEENERKPGTIGCQIELRNVSFSFSEHEKPLIRGISLSIQPGTLTAIIGPSGAGKTTLADLILGIYEPTDGEILADGGAPASFLRMRPGVVGYVPQKPETIAGSVADNVALGEEASDRDESRIREVLSQVGLSKVVSELPLGIHSQLGSHSDGLSGGEIQRLGIARALYRRPSLLVLDEPTSALDSGNEALVTETIKSLRQEVTIIVIAHRLSTIRGADLVYYIEDGLVRAEGSFDEVRRKIPKLQESINLFSPEQTSPDAAGKDD